MAQSGLWIVALCMTAILFAATHVHADKPPCEPPDCCSEDGDCPEGYYCAKAYGDCDGEGTCQSREPPEGYGWVCTADWMPVRGCDGNIYGNGCEAFIRNINIAFECSDGTDGFDTDSNDDGIEDSCILANDPSCMPPDCCSEDDNCPEGYYCAKAIGDCDGAGSCQPLETEEESCSEIWLPVRGCDGKIYSNDCHARRANMNIAYMCDGDTVGSDTDINDDGLNDSCNPHCLAHLCGTCIIGSGIAVLLGLIDMKRAERRKCRRTPTKSR